MIEEHISISSHDKSVVGIDVVGSHIIPFPYMFRKLDAPKVNLGC